MPPPTGGKARKMHGKAKSELDFPSDMPGADLRRRLSVLRCKPCASPHDRGDMPKYLPAGLTQYALSNFSKKSSPYHATQDDVSTPLQRLEVEKVTGHQSVRGRGGVIAAMYQTHWTGLSRPSWKREMDLQLSCHALLRYWAGTPEPAPPNQPPVPPNDNRRGTTGAFSE